MITNEEEARKFFENNKIIHREAVKEIIAPQVNISKYVELRGQTYYYIGKNNLPKT